MYLMSHIKTKKYYYTRRTFLVKDSAASHTAMTEMASKSVQ